MRSAKPLCRRVSRSSHPYLTGRTVFLPPHSDPTHVHTSAPFSVYPRRHISSGPDLLFSPVLLPSPRPQLIPDIGLDPGFKNFYDWCKANNIPFVIVSSGMEPTIRAVLETLLPAEDAGSIDIISNDVKFTDPAGKGETWEIVYRHPDSGFGHDKSKAILPYRDLAHKPTLFFCGDGVSGGFILHLMCIRIDVRLVGRGACRCLVREGDGEWRF